MSGISGTGFDYGQIAHSMGQSNGASQSNLGSFGNTSDPSQTEDMKKLQTLTQQWTNAVNLESTTLQMIGDALRRIVGGESGGSPSPVNNVPPVPNWPSANNISQAKAPKFITGDQNADKKNKSEIIALGNMLNAMRGIR